MQLHGPTLVYRCVGLLRQEHNIEPQSGEGACSSVNSEI